MKPNYPIFDIMPDKAALDSVSMPMKAELGESGFFGVGYPYIHNVYRKYSAYKKEEDGDYSINFFYHYDKHRLESH